MPHTVLVVSARFWHVLILNAAITVVCVCMAVFYPHIGDILR
jgi:hypothetical protein